MEIWEELLCSLWSLKLEECKDIVEARCREDWSSKNTGKESHWSLIMQMKNIFLLSTQFLWHFISSISLPPSLRNSTIPTRMNKCVCVCAHRALWTLIWSDIKHHVSFSQRNGDGFSAVRIRVDRSTGHFAHSFGWQPSYETPGHISCSGLSVFLLLKTDGSQMVCCLPRSMTAFQVE